MIAKIIKGTNFSGVVNYMLSKREGKVKVLQANGVRSSLPMTLHTTSTCKPLCVRMYKNQFVIPYSHSQHMIQND